MNGTLRKDVRFQQIKSARSASGLTSSISSSPKYKKHMATADSSSSRLLPSLRSPAKKKGKLDWRIGAIDNAARRGFQMGEPLRSDLSMLEAFNDGGRLPDRQATVPQRTLDMRKTFSAKVTHTRDAPQRTIVSDDVDSNLMKKNIKDMRMLAASCRRAGNADEEAAAHFRLGVMYDNLRQYGSAVSSYKRYMQICRDRDDAQGIALACNAVGADYHLMARRAKKEGLSDPAVKKTFSDLLKDARRHHKEHLSLSSDDTRSKFTAASNLGLVATDLGDADTAMNNFQTALKAATAVGDARMQSVALANLGMHAMTVGNLEMTNKCMEQRLELVLTTHDDREEAKTLHALGECAAQSKQLEIAAELFLNAQEVAKRCDARAVYKSAKCKYAIAKGQLELKSRMEALCAFNEG